MDFMEIALSDYIRTGNVITQVRLDPSLDEYVAVSIHCTKDTGTKAINDDGKWMPIDLTQYLDAKYYVIGEC